MIKFKNLEIIAKKKRLNTKDNTGVSMNKRGFIYVLAYYNQ